jgi:DNA-binding CsgD family transcriptional regulator
MSPEDLSELGTSSVRAGLREKPLAPEHAMSTLHFTPRGREVFALIVEGLTSKRISERLGMGVNGIKRHKDKMLLQNDCETMRDLIVKYSSTAERNTETDTPLYERGTLWK